MIVELNISKVKNFLSRFKAKIHRFVANFTLKLAVDTQLALSSSPTARPLVTQGDLARPLVIGHENFVISFCPLAIGHDQTIEGNVIA